MIYTINNNRYLKCSTPLIEYIKSKHLYNMYNNNHLDKNIAKRCCNFKLLEEKYLEYNTVKN